MLKTCHTATAAPSDFKLGQELWRPVNWWRQSEHGVASWLRLINHHSAVIAIGAGSGTSKFYSTLLLTRSSLHLVGLL